jgi:hypothetical protein
MHWSVLGLEYKLWHAISRFATDKYHPLQIKSALRRIPVQGRSIANQPDMPKRIDEPALTMRSPGRLVIPDFIKATVCTRFHGTRDHRIRIVAEQLDPDGRRTYRFGTLPAIPGWLSQEERCTLNLQTHD